MLKLSSFIFLKEQNFVKENEEPLGIFLNFSLNEIFKIN
jgi:hypothetical protein